MRRRGLVGRVKPVAAIGGSYPATVVTQGLQAVWDLRVGGSTTVGIRTPTTKTLGVDILPAGATYAGGFLRVTGTVTMDNWDFSTIAANGYVYTDGTGVVTFNDCKFGYHPSNTSQYMLSAGDGGTPTTICNYCTFDGDRLANDNTTASVFSPIGSASITQLNYCDFVDMPEDGIKTAGGNYTIRYCRFQSVGWDEDSDPDCIQFGGGSIDCQYCLFDVRDGSDLGVAFPGQGLNNYFRAESFGGVITSVIFKNNICVGGLAFMVLFNDPGPPAHDHRGNFVSIDAKDVNPNAITSVLYENNVIQAGSSRYTYQDGSTRYPNLTGAEWLDNIDFDTGATIAPNT